MSTVSHGHTRRTSYRNTLIYIAIIVTLSFVLEVGKVLW